MGLTTRQRARRAAGSGRLLAAALLVAAAGLLGIAMCGAPASSQAPQTGPKAAPAGAAKRPAAPPQVRYGTDGLPRPVLDLREAMEAAVEAGRIEELRHALDLSDIKPDLGIPPQAHAKPDAKADARPDATEHWKGISGDGNGRDVLAALSLILESGYVIVPRGADVENNKVYVWPYFAEIPLSELTPRQEVELLRLVPASAAREMREKGKYTYWRLVIGADGTWHAFRKGE